MRVKGIAARYRGTSASVRPCRNRTTTVAAPRAKYRRASRAKAATIGGMSAWKPLAVAALPALLLIGCASANRPLQFIGGTDLVYPTTARQQGIEGMVTVRYDVTADGAVENAAVEAATPPGVFDAAALAAVRTWRFNPPLRDGEPVAAPGQVSTLRFQLGDTSRYSRTGMGP